MPRQWQTLTAFRASSSSSSSSSLESSMPLAPFSFLGRTPSSSSKLSSSSSLPISARSSMSASIVRSERQRTRGGGQRGLDMRVVGEGRVQGWDW
ncbi:hypothetical protein K504DRAFT_45477 [Pleomassaria siparia CBS 279.74]|uniref:Uncharacterized protein n=1 Tax=Pleomassaria siparia CBS 279.74 TaxID=1314801 RepID=A0A6G1K5X8_9PLEO|nr:hypothetical protein K504DRAFT_45477 [Pleomassaria siparia CBS 279.74]